MSQCDRYDPLMTENSRIELALWLLGLRLTPKATVRGSVVLSAFRALFGTPESTKRIIVSGLLTILASVLIGISMGSKSPFWKSLIESLHFAFLLAFFGLGIGANEYAISYTSKVRSALVTIATLVLVIAEGVTAIVFWLGVSYARLLSSPHLQAIIFRVGIVPLIVVTIWIWLPFLTRFSLKITRRMDAALAWHNDKIDVAKFPLKAIAPVAGSVAAVSFTAVAFFGRWILLLKK